ncbi:unnamed protein product [Closterium sp. NIES-65]|nr:unnamed protein product [Closterium sp. NIES-65]
MPAHSAISRTSTGSEAREGMRRRIQLAQPCGEAGAEGRGGEGREGEGYRGRSGSDAQPGRQGVCAEPGGVGRAGFGNTVPAREEAELRCGSGAERCNEAQRVGLRLQGEHATELDRRLEAALRSGDHTAALRVNEAIIRRESARRQRQAEWHMQLAASLQEQESARRKKRQRLNWGMDVLRKSEGKGNIVVRAFTELTFESAPSRSQLVRAFTELAPSIQYPVPISPPSPLFPRLSRLNPIPLSSPSPTFFPHPPPLSPRSAFPRPPGDVVSCGVDRAFTELAELDKSPGSDGRQVINVPELYTGILIVYDKVNQLVPGMHIKPPSKKQVLQLVQDYDINHDGVLDREEFGKLVRHFARTVVARVLINVLLIFSLVPLVVSIASNLAETFGWELPEAIAATVLTLLVKMVGV